MEGVSSSKRVARVARPEQTESPTPFLAHPKTVAAEPAPCGRDKLVPELGTARMPPACPRRAWGSALLSFFAGGARCSPHGLGRGAVRKDEADEPRGSLCWVL